MRIDKGKWGPPDSPAEPGPGCEAFTKTWTMVNILVDSLHRV
jgi:hypothetical protein